MNKSKKIFVIIAIIFVIIISAIATISILYIKTDLLKSSRELFAKYMQQNIVVLNELKETKVPSIYDDIKQNNKYEKNTNINLEYSEGGETSNPLNNLSIKIDTKNDSENKYAYIDGKLLFREKEYLKVELLKEEDMYGLKFSEMVKQFVTVKKDENFNTVVQDIGINEETINMFINMLDGQGIIEQKITIEEIQELIDKYINILMQNMDSVGTYEKLRNAMITIDNKTVKTNAYSIKLSKEQVKKIIIEVLNNVKTDEKIQSIIKDVYKINEFTESIDDIIKQIEENSYIEDTTITVYEKQGTTVRTVITMGKNQIVIENKLENGNIKLNIKKNELNSEQVKQQNVEIIKESSENQEKYDIIITGQDGETKQIIEIINELKTIEEGINIDTKISYKEGITTVSLVMNNKVTIKDSIEQSVKRDNTNNITLNDISQGSRIKVIDRVKEIIPQKYEERIELLKKEMGLIEEEPSQEPKDESEMTTVEINRFNAKFEFYTGSEVTAESVKELLEIVKSDTKSVEFPTLETETEDQSSNKKNLLNMKINIEKDKENKELIETVLNKIEKGRKYKVEISYKESNIIDYITITQVK